MKLISVNLGPVMPLFVQQGTSQRRVVSGIHKQAAPGMVAVDKLGLAGDEQADLTVHGGLDKAVYAYPIEHYGFWAAQRLAALKRDEPLPPGSMGENLTVQGLLESGVWIGDRLQIGGVLLEVTQPRQPCFKFNAKMGFAHATKMMLQSGFSGFYLRVIKTGSLGAGDAITLIAGARRMTVAQVVRQRALGRQRDLF